MTPNSSSRIESATLCLAPDTDTYARRVALLSRLKTTLYELRAQPLSMLTADQARAYAELGHAVEIAIHVLRSHSRKLDASFSEDIPS